MTNLRAAVRAFMVVLIGVGAFVSTVTVACAQTTAASRGAKSYKIEISGRKQWVDTNINLRSGAKLRFTATGQITYPPDQSRAGKLHTQGTFGPDGLPRGFADLIHDYPVASARHGALIGRLGSEDYAQPFLIGASRDYDVPVAGRLFLGMNQSQDAETATGSFEVTVTFSARARATRPVLEGRWRLPSQASHRICSARSRGAFPTRQRIPAIWSTF